MPTYAYLCTQCSHAFEIHQSFTDDALTVCPECEGRLRKQFSSVGVVFKGSGFYRNDARSGSKSSSLPAASGSSTSSAPAAAPAPSAPATPAPAAASSSGGTSATASKASA